MTTEKCGEIRARTIPAFVDGILMPVEKLEVHRRGLKHPAVSVFVMCGDRTLLQRRALSKYHTPGLWANACCTHPAWDEPPGSCATRRLREELGLTVRVPEFRDRVEYRADVGGGLIEHEVVDIFRVEVAANTPIRANPDEVMDTRWIALDDLHDAVADDPACYTPWLRIYLTDHAARIFDLKD